MYGERLQEASPSRHFLTSNNYLRARAVTAVNENERLKANRQLANAQTALTGQLPVICLRANRQEIASNIAMLHFNMLASRRQTPSCLEVDVGEMF